MYKITKSIKFKGKYLKIGQQVELTDSEHAYLSSKGFIADVKGYNRLANELVEENKTKAVKEDTKVKNSDYTKMKKSELKVMLDNQNIKYNEQDTREELIKKLAR